jgi:hypothetical protein
MHPWYSTPSQIPARTSPDWNFLAAARCQDRIDVVIKNSCLEVLLLELSIATRYGTSRVYALIHNFVTHHKIFL